MKVKKRSPKAKRKKTKVASKMSEREFDALVQKTINDHEDVLKRLANK